MTKLRPRFSLRTMLIVVTVAAVLLGLWIVPSERQRRAVGQIEALGGQVEIDQKLYRHVDWYLHYSKNVVGVCLPKLHDSTRIDWAALPKLKSVSLMEETAADSIHAVDSIIEDRFLQKNLTFLGLSTRKEFDYVMDHIAKFKNLHQLYLNNSSQHVTDAQLESLGNLTELRELSMTISADTPIKPASWRFLEKLTHLKELSLAVHSWDVADDVQLEKLAKLESLSLEEICSNRTLEKISRLPNLKKLSYEVSKGEEWEFASIASISTLQELNFDNGTEKWIGLQHLAQLKNLRTLRFWFNCKKVDDAVVADLQDCVQLEQLFLYAKLSDKGLQHLAKMDKLKKLELTSCRFIGRGLEGFPPLPNLETLNLETTAGKCSLMRLKECKKLRTLLMNRSDLCDSPDIEKLRKELPGIKIEAYDGFD